MIFDRIKLAQFLDHLIENFLSEVTHFVQRGFKIEWAEKTYKPQDGYLYPYLA
jgi:hypothetical protein